MNIFRLIPLLFFIHTLQAQDKIANDFRFPLDGKARFSGNYGELRPNHFHAGLDFRTHPVKNLPIYAVADGYVSRIKIGTHGYGKVLYVTHANGYVSVYGHQYKFADKIYSYAYTEQKKQETFEIELFPKPEELPVKKGEIIGYTGNTGNSSGPHLHFEIRDEKTETPLNPQLFFAHEDAFAPVCTKMGVYSVPEQGKPTLVKTVDLNAQAGKKEMQIKETLTLPPNAGFAFSCYDKESADAGKNQVYGISIKVDGEQIYLHKMNGISFDHARYVNWFQDVSPGVKNDKLQRCFKTGNNDLQVFSELKNDGIIQYDGAKLKSGNHNAEVKFFDVNGNATVLKFSFNVSEQKKENVLPQYNFSCLKENTITVNSARFKFPEKCLFYDTDTRVKEINTSKQNFYSGVYRVFDDGTPLLKGFEVNIDVTKKFEGLEDKLCIVTMKDNMGGLSYAGGKLENGKMSGLVKSCGLIAVAADTVAPRITVRAHKGKSTRQSVNYTVGDNLSGIGKFKLEVNGKWVLAEYEHKTNTIYYNFDKATPSGELTLKLKVWDKQNNLAEHTQVIRR